MTTATLKLSGIQKKVQDGIESVEISSTSWKAIFIVGLLMMSLSLIFYVYQINNLTKGTYFVNNYEKQINQLTKENKNLEISFAEGSFLGKIQQKTQDLNFQKTVSVKYVKILDSSVALNGKK